MTILEVIVQTDYRGQEIINRWNYVGGGTPAAVTPSFALASALGAIPSGGVYPSGSFLKKMAALMVTEAKLLLITVQNVYDPTDFYSTPFVPDFPGAAAGEGMSPAVAVGFFSNRLTRDIRRATKRIAGISEAANAPGGVLSTTYTAAVAPDFAAVMGEVLEYDDEGNTLTFTPAVCSKEKYQPDPEIERFAYRYYSTLASQMSHTAVGITWDYYTTLRTQASRQYGHGR